MTTSQTLSFLTEVLEGTPIPVGKLEYFRSRLKSHLHQLVLAEWLRNEDRGLSQAELGRRIGRKPEVINRLLGAPGNWTLETVSDLLIGMGAVPFVETRKVRDLIESEQTAPEVEVRKPQTLEAMTSPQPARSAEQSPPISGATAAALGR